MIKLQNSFTSAHLLDSWLLDALKFGLNLKPLFESSICTQAITRENFENASQFSQFHMNPKRKTYAFRKGIVNFMYSDTIYEDVFGRAFDGKDFREKS
jgi:hypothetical protein